MWLFWSKKHRNNLEGWNLVCSIILEVRWPGNRRWPHPVPEQPHGDQPTGIWPKIRLLPFPSIQQVSNNSIFWFLFLGTPHSQYYFAFQRPIYSSDKEGYQACFSLGLSLLAIISMLQQCMGSAIPVPDGCSCPGQDGLLVTTYPWGWAGRPMIWSTCITCRASKWTLLSCSRPKTLPLVYK